MIAVTILIAAGCGIVVGWVASTSFSAWILWRYPSLIKLLNDKVEEKRNASQ